MKLNILLILTLITASNMAYSSSNILTSINWVGQRGNGNVIANFNTTIDQPECTSSQLEISASNESAKGLLSILLAAYMGESKVYVNTDGCFNGAPTISTTGYIHTEPK